MFVQKFLLMISLMEDVRFWTQFCLVGNAEMLVWEQREYRAEYRVEKDGEERANREEERVERRAIRLKAC